MNLLELQSGKQHGYRIVSKDGDSLVTLAGNERVDDRIGAKHNYTGNGLYLGTSKKFVEDYYSGLSDLPDVMLTYIFDVDDVLSGDPSSPDSEITVSKAVLQNVETISEDV
jgi:hypothetical protein